MCDTTGLTFLQPVGYVLERRFMAKYKKNCSDSYWEKKYQELQHYTKRLEKEIKKIKKENLLTPKREKSTIENKKTYCPECGKGELNMFDILNRKFLVCNVCKYRERFYGKKD